MNLRPIRADVYFYYKCPFCSVEHQQEFKSIKLIGRLVCFCGKLLTLEKMTAVKIEPTYVIPQVKPLSTTKSKPDYFDITRSLSKLGYDKAQIKHCIDNVSAKNKTDKPEELYQLCLIELIGELNVNTGI